MRKVTLVLAAALVLAGAVAANRVLARLGAPEVAQLLIGGTFVAIRQVDEALARLLARVRLLRARPAVGEDGFGLPWYLMIVYGTFLLAAAVNVAGFVAGVTAGAIGAEGNDIGIVLGIDVLVVATVVLYFLGAWLGARCNRYGLVVLFAVPILARTLVAGIDYGLLDAAAYEELIGQDKSVTTLLETTVLGVIVFSAIAAVFGLVGYWRGRRIRPSHYLQHMLGELPRETRETILALAREEARRPRAVPAPA